MLTQVSLNINYVYYSSSSNARVAISYIIYCEKLRQHLKCNYFQILEMYLIDIKYYGYVCSRYILNVKIYMSFRKLVIKNCWLSAPPPTPPPPSLLPLLSSPLLQL